ATAFKTRFATQAISEGSTVGAGGSTPSIPQNVPGRTYNSESGFVPTAIGMVFEGGTPGVADSGTRLKAVLNNIPKGARIFVTIANVVGPAGRTGFTLVETPNSSAASAFAVL